MEDLEIRLGKLTAGVAALAARLSKTNPCHSAADGKFCSTGGSGGGGGETVGGISGASALMQSAGWKPDASDPNYYTKKKRENVHEIIIKPNGEWHHLKTPGSKEKDTGIVYRGRPVFMGVGTGEASLARHLTHLKTNRIV